MPVIAILVTLVTVSAWAAGGLLTPAGAATVINVPCRGVLSTLKPTAGSTIQLSRGCTYTGYLTIRSDHVTVTAYGSGSAPALTRGTDGAAISLYGSHDTVKSLTLSGVAPPHLDV
jgi:hypothetical protein